MMMIVFTLLFSSDEKPAVMQRLRAFLIPVQPSGPPPHGLMIHGTLLLFVAPVFLLSPVPVGKNLFCCPFFFPFLPCAFIIADRKAFVNSFLSNLGKIFPNIRVNAVQPGGGQSGDAPQPAKRLYHLFRTFSAKPVRFLTWILRPSSRTAVPVKRPNT